LALSFNPFVLLKALTERKFPKARAHVPTNERMVRDALRGAPEWEKAEKQEIFWDIFNKEAWVAAAVREIKTWVMAKGWRLKPVVEEPDEDQLRKAEEFLGSPNPDDTFDDLLEDAVTDLEIFGDAFWELARKVEEDGTITKELGAIYSMDTVRMSIKADVNGNIEGFHQTKENQDKDFFPRKDILHFKLQARGRNLFGRSPLSSLKLPIETDLWAQIYNREFFKNNGTPSIVITVDENVGDEQFEEIKAALDTFKGAAQAHQNLLLWGNVKFDKLSTTPKEMSFPELRRMSREEILAVYGVPPGLIGIIEVGNIGAGSGDFQMEKFLNGVIKPLQRKLSGRVNRVILRRELGVTDYEFEFIQEDVPADLDRARSEVAKFKGGLTKRNESRASLGLPPVEGGDEFATPSVQGLSDPLGLESKAASPEPRKNPIPGIPNIEGGVQKISASIITLLEKWRDRILVRFDRLTKQDIDTDEILSDIKSEEAAGVLVAGLATTSRSGIQAAAELGGDSSAAIFARARPALEQQAREWAVPFTDRTRLEIIDIIDKGTLAGKPVPEIRRDIQGYFDRPLVIDVAPVIDEDGNVVRKGHTRTMGQTEWAQMTARSQGSEAANESALISYSAAGVEEVKWKTAPTGVDPEICAPRNNRVWRIDDPSRPRIPKDSHNNCRCHWAPVPPSEG